MTDDTRPRLEATLRQLTPNARSDGDLSKLTERALSLTILGKLGANLDQMTENGQRVKDRSDVFLATYALGLAERQAARADQAANDVANETRRAAARKRREEGRRVSTDPLPNSGERASLGKRR